jgi:uncharacterized phage protein (TIGR02218 family)
MARDLTDHLASEINEPEHRPIELYIICLDNYTLYFTDHDENISFYDLDGNAQAYVSVAISRGEVRHNIDNHIDSVVVRLNNVNLAMSEYIASYEFRGRRLVILRVYENYLSDSSDYITIFDGLMDLPVIGETSLQVTLKSRIGTLTHRVPRRMYQVHCNWEFGSTECGFNKGASEIADETVASGSTANTVRLDGVEYENYDDDRYKYGTIEFTAGNNDKQTRLITYSSGTFALTGTSGMQMGIGYALPFSPIGDTVTVNQGCDKTKAYCETPHNNLVNFGGFDTTPQVLDRK